MAPGLVTPEKAARGKLPTDVWWHTIVPTAGREKTGYPTQKPEGIVRAHGARVDAARRLVPRPLRRQRARSAPWPGRRGRRYVLIDESPTAVAVMRERLGDGEG